MLFSFSAEFMKILPPAMNFGEAWENLCLCLLRADTSDNSIMRLGPPDRGIDIFRERTKDAYQCKSDERGVFGTISPQDCIISLNTAVAARKSIDWKHYSIALNAPLSGVGLTKITDCAKSKSLDDSTFSILPAEYWSELCERHSEAVKHLFDYRVFISETQVLEALKKARYYDRFVFEAAEKMKRDPLRVTVSNNRTPIELTLPFSGDLTIQQLLDILKVTLGVSLDWANFPDLGTSCGPSLSITIDRKSQPFKLKLSELTPEQRAKLQLWIQLIWRDDLEKDHDHFDGTAYLARYHLGAEIEHRFDPRERGKLTLDRMQTAIQMKIWQAVSETVRPESWK
jgi:hypothetical protein